jgi:type I restriction enzyme S subunit
MIRSNAPLADVCLKITDGTHHSPPIVPNGVPYVTAKHIKLGGIRFFDDPWFVSQQDHDEIYSRCDPQPGDVLYIKDGATTGIAAVNSYDFPFSMLSSVALLRPDPNVCDGRYLAAWLNAPRTKAKHLGSMGGAAIKRLTLAKIKGFRIPLPPLPEQKRIAAILDAADALRAKRRESIEQLDSLVQATFLEMFGDPMTNPKRWEMGNIADLMASVSYGTSKKANPAIGEFPILRMGNITYDGGWDLRDIKFIDLDKKEQGKYLVRRGDLLFNRTNSKELVGKTAVYRGDAPMAFAGYLVRAVTNERASPEYVGAFMNSRQTKSVLQNMCKAIVGMANINASEFKMIRIPIPPRSLQDRFSSIVESIDHHKARLQSHLAELDALFSSLQSRAFNGELVA